MKKMLYQFRNSIVAAILTLTTLTMTFVAVPVQAAVLKNTSGEMSEVKTSFDLRLFYNWDAKRPSLADAEPVNIVIMRSGKAVAHINNLKYGMRYDASLADGIYTVAIYSAKTGAWLESLRLAHSTNQKDNDLNVVIRLPGTNQFPTPRVNYGFMAE